MIETSDWVFNLNPKTGTTSITHMLRDSGYEADAGHATYQIKEAPYKRHYTVVRNPFDRMVSAFHYWNARDRYSDFHEFFTGPAKFVVNGCMIDILRTDQSYWYGNCKPYETNVLRYENLVQDFNRFCEREAVIVTTGFYHKNKSMKRTAGYKDVIDPKSRDIIFDRFHQDFRVLGYDW